MQMNRVYVQFYNVNAWYYWPVGVWISLGSITKPSTGALLPKRVVRDVAEEADLVETLGGIGISDEWPEMQSAPVSSWSQYTSTMRPLGFSGDSDPGIPINLAPRGICITIFQRVNSTSYVILFFLSSYVNLYIVLINTSSITSLQGIPPIVKLTWRSCKLLIGDQSPWEWA